jgi:hypothetical protein
MSSHGRPQREYDDYCPPRDHRRERYNVTGMENEHRQSEAEEYHPDDILKSDLWHGYAGY